MTFLRHESLGTCVQISLWAIGGLLLSSAGAAVGHATDAMQSKPNVLFIIADDWNDWVGCLGNEQVKTPHVDRLATQGMLFTNAHCAAPVCNPSRVAMWTGLHADTTGVYENNHSMRKKVPGVVTLPQHLRQHGYKTFGGGKIFHDVPPHCAENDTFDEFFWWNAHGARGGRSNGRWRSPYSIPPDPEPPGRPTTKITSITKRNFTWGAIDQAETTWPDRMVADWATEVLSRQHDRPFMLAVGMFRPHVPWFNPAEYFDLYPLDDVDLPNVKTDDLDDLGEWARRRARDRVSKHGEVVEFGEWRPAVQAYLASISFSDAMIGRLLDALDRSAYRGNTMVVFCSDHGYHLGEKEHWHKRTLWRRSTRVPLIISVPAMMTGGSACDSPVNLVDLFPTLCELCEIPTPQDLEGHSLAPLLQQPTDNWPYVSRTTYFRGNYAISGERFRYIRYATGDEELYHIESDPHEWKNLAGDPQFSAVKARLAVRCPTSHVASAAAPISPGIADDADANDIDEPTTVPVFVLGDGRKSRYGYRIPSVVTTREGTLLAFAERRLGLGDHAENDIVLRRSADNGSSWGDLLVVYEDGAKSLNNPCAVVLPDTGRVLLMYQSFPADRHSRAIGKNIGRAEPGIAGEKVVKTLLQYSDDDGKTWSTPRDVTAGAKRAERIVANATGPGIGIVLHQPKHRGRILMPHNESWYDGDDRHFNVYASYSDDGGSTWQLGKPAPYDEQQAGEGNEVQMVELSDGSVMLNTRTSKGNRLRKVGISRDGGITWTPLVDDPQLIEPQCMGSIIRARLPAKEDGDALLFSCPGSKKGRQNGTIYASFDDGKTWPVSQILEPGGFAYSCLVQLADGTLGCLYEADGYKQIVFARFSSKWLFRDSRAP